jgi:hypothetical protein
VGSSRSLLQNIAQFGPFSFEATVVWSERISSSSICIIAVLISKLCVCAQAQQLQGRSYSEADSYIVGGPVLFNLEIKNTGSEDVYLHAKNPSGRLDTYAFSVQRRTLQPVAQTGMPNTRCGVCIKTGGIGTEAQWPLNFWYQFEGEGEYEVSVTGHTEDEPWSAFTLSKAWVTAEMPAIRR